MNAPNSEHWLTRPATIRLIWIVSIAALAATLLLQMIYPVKGYFGVDEWFGFGAVFGFFSCVVMVLASKLLGVFLKRSDDYYLKDTGEEDIDA